MHQRLSAHAPRLSLIVLVALASGVGCTGNQGPCEANLCMCEDGDECEFVCEDEPCTGVCSSLTDCVGTCRDGCDLACTSTTGCDLACGDTCAVDCSSVSNCTVECGTDCDVECTDLSSCTVRMLSGRVLCTSSGSCDIGCAQLDGSMLPATECGDGVYVCAPATCEAEEG